MALNFNLGGSLLLDSLGPLLLERYQFVSEDPIGYADGLNLYRYYPGLSAMDPMGLFYASTFGGNIHADILKEALAKSITNKKHMNEIIKANKEQDSSKKRKDGGSNATDKKRHFDGPGPEEKLEKGSVAERKRFQENIRDSLDYLAKLAKDANNKGQTTTCEELLKILGEYSHTLADFYSHSNFVNLVLEDNQREDDLRPEDMKDNLWDVLDDHGESLKKDDNKTPKNGEKKPLIDGKTLVYKRKSKDGKDEEIWTTRYHAPFGNEKATKEALDDPRSHMNEAKDAPENAQLSNIFSGGSTNQHRANTRSIGIKDSPERELPYEVVSTISYFDYAKAAAIAHTKKQFDKYFKERYECLCEGKK